MLNPFPELLTYSLLAPFIIRIVLGTYFFLYGLPRAWKIYLKRAGGIPVIQTVVTGASFVGAIFVFIGFLTQVGAILLSLTSLYLVCADSTHRDKNLLLLAMSLSILLSGAGAFAFDLPL